MSEFGVPTDEQLAKINKLAKRQLSADEVFFFSGKSAGDLMIPNRYTRLSPELLQVMIEDAKKGVSFMLNHNWSSWSGIQGIPYGKVFDGRIVPSSEEGETVEMHLDKFIFRDDEVTDGVSANALIKRIETGILSDTSIGFSTDTMVCSICGMNYWGGQCSHYRGRTYDMADGSKKVCYVTAMPPSIIIPYNNNALFEESIVWDGAYPGAMVAQSKHGDIIETPTGKFSIIDDKEELPENTPLIGHYHNGNIVTMVKKSVHKKVFHTGGVVANSSISNPNNDHVLPNAVVDELNKAVHIMAGSDGKLINLKGVESSMNENVKKILESFGIEVDENYKPDEIMGKLAEAWVSIPSVEPQEGQIAQYMTQEQVTEKLGAELSADEVLKLAKEGQEYRKQLIDETIAMGVRAMGNDFKTETWKATLSTMETSAIKDIMANFETQANASIPAGRKTDPAAGQRQTVSAPDEAFKVGR